MSKSPALNYKYFSHSGKILASALLLSKKLARPGITTVEIDFKIHNFIVKYKAIPSFLGLNGYAHASCISINNQVVHGAPTNIPLKLGDLITVDIGVSYKNHCTDAARTFVIGAPTTEQQNLIDTSKSALDSGIKEAITGNRIGDISYAIQRCVELNGFRSPLDYGGHGIGFKPHLNPFISNTGIKGKGKKLIEGQGLALEPIVMAGSIEIFIDGVDECTCYSKDGALSAHIEDTIIVSDLIPLILTRETLNGGIV
ncbi:MAG: type I methionyl aminopeptidase [Candidatus Peribacteraceae bacterium]|nr:type I methionyl aminopeptidase [Candidatus Peribacteraceae bacterium]